MMKRSWSLVDRINGWLLRRLKPKTGRHTVSVSPQELTVREGGEGEIRIPWSAITRIVALAKDVYMPSDFQVMFIEWQQQTIEINEDMPGWNALVEAIDRYVTGAIPSGQWLLEIQAAIKRPITIYSRATAPPNTASPAS